MINTNVNENDIDKGSFDGHPAGYISLGDQDGEPTVFASTILGDNFVLNLFVKTNTNEHLDEVMNSFSLKSHSRE